MSIKNVLIVEDHPSSIEWLEGIVLKAFPLSMVFRATRFCDALKCIEESFDLALIDLSLPDGSGIDLLRRMQEESPDTRCVVHTVLNDDSNIVAALSAGAEGYLLKEQPEDLVCKQLSDLMLGIPAMTPSIARRIMDHFRLTGPEMNDNDKISEREKQVLSLISRGLRNADVADLLQIAPHTVATHIKTIYRKLDISSRAEASWYATRMGL